MPVVNERLFFGDMHLPDVGDPMLGDEIFQRDILDFSGWWQGVKGWVARCER